MDLEIERLQSEQKKILSYVKEVCDYHRITFYLAYGTCLGSIRHNGFIPWDDDIDIFMKHEDYKRFCSVLVDSDSHFFLQNHRTDPEFGLPIGRVRNSDTTLIEDEFKDRDINHGIYIDIYPLYNCPEGFFVHRFFVVVSYLSRLFLWGRGTKNKSKFMNIATQLLVRSVPPSFQKRVISYFERYIVNWRHTGNYATFYGNDAARTYGTEVFGQPKKCLFEGVEYPIPSDSNAFLTSMYGDYMELPKLEDRKVHHNYIFLDVSKSYKRYRGFKYLVN